MLEDDQYFFGNIENHINGCEKAKKFGACTGLKLEVHINEMVITHFPTDFRIVIALHLL